MDAGRGRVTDYDSIAAGYDRRYDFHAYAGVKESLTNFLSGDAVATVLEVGCGTGHWLAAVEARLKPSPYDHHPQDRSASDERQDRSAKALAERPLLVGLEPSAPMLARARIAAPGTCLLRGKSEQLPFADASLDRIFCVNALHHFADRVRFFAEARRVLKPDGGLLTLGKDPHTERDQWWVYDYFPDTLERDRQRFAPVRILRGELAHAGFAWAESSEADRIEALTPAGEALATGVVDRAYTSQLAMLSDEELDAGAARIREADAAADGQLDLVTDFRLYATIGWV